MTSRRLPERRAALATACSVGCALLLAWAPGSAHAFSDPLSFADPVELGGGGGRFFTGSAADGYTCDVCHAGGDSPKLRLLGLPLAGYVPATAYEIRVEWPTELEHLGLALELTDSAGRAAGSLRLPTADELPNEERCEPVEDGIMAGVLTETEARSVLSVPDCGARRVRFLWTAPAQVQGTLRFAGGLVASDNQADAEGDGVTLFAHALPPAQSAGAPVSEISGQCSVRAAGSGRGAYTPALLLLALTWWRLSYSRSRHHSRRALRSSPRGRP